MNKILQLKGQFEQAKWKGNVNGPVLPPKKSVEVKKLEKLKKDLIEFKKIWEKEKVLPGALISVFYNKIAAKSNRIQGLLSKGAKTASGFIVGAKFTEDSSPKHIITHYVPMSIIDESINRLNKSIDLLNKHFSGKISSETLKEFKFEHDDFNRFKTSFKKIIVDAFYVEKLDLLIDNLDLKNDSIITIYKTDIETVKLLEKIGIKLNFHKIMDETTILLTKDQLDLLKDKAPYLISMAVSDISQLTKENFEYRESKPLLITSPKNEPIIGVIDTMFDKEVYFSEWVEFKNMLSKDIPLEASDYKHGTAVSSIIVDGPSFNPDLDDGCGRFRVKHFGVASSGKFSSFSILKNIKEIVLANKDIKVWNLSLGSMLEINKNFISPEASILDKIQYENDVIFVVAGTNKNSGDKNTQFIGAPADSINSLVVNSVTFDNQPTSYSRRGPVLSFFTKPDISYYGGESKKPIRVCLSTGESFVRGTSFAAPWVARKMSYLIDILGLSREVAKALLINSATGWDKERGDSFLYGHGIVPVKIDNIIQSKEDEIQFLLSGTSEEHSTYNYNLPIPISQEKHPFVAKATLCYFPYCSRNQGVDYTNTELEFSFGRIKNEDKGISKITNNYRDDQYQNYLWEKEARSLFRKWDNIKHIQENFTKRVQAKKVYDSGLWGINLRTFERSNEKYGKNLKFGIVVTLKEINGINRIDDFIKNCSLRGWIVNRLEVKNKIKIYNKANEEITFE